MVPLIEMSRLRVSPKVVRRCMFNLDKEVQHDSEICLLALNHLCGDFAEE